MTDMSADQMMDLVEILDDQVDDITEALTPLLQGSLQDVAAKLPVVDKARLYVLTTYAIDSLIFSYLRLNGINAREHPVMRELERVKQYVKKINEAQSKSTSANANADTSANITNAGASAEAKREATLNKEVAARFVKHDLSGNDKWDRERAAEKAREKAAAHTKFEELSRKIEKREAENPPMEEELEEEQGNSESDEEDLKDKYEHEEILTINDTEDIPGEKKLKNEEQVNRILNTFKGHGVPVSPAGKRRPDEDTSGGSEADMRRRIRNSSKKMRRKERKEAGRFDRSSNNSQKETLPNKGKKKSFRI